MTSYASFAKILNNKKKRPQNPQVSVTERYNTSNICPEQN